MFGRVAHTCHWRCSLLWHHRRWLGRVWLTRGNLAPSSLLISMIIQCYSIQDGMIWRDAFEHLWMFCGGLANAFANTTSLESDFSIVKWENLTFDNQWWTGRWRAFLWPNNAVLWWEFLFRLGLMMVLGPNRTSDWHFYNLRHEN